MRHLEVVHDSLCPVSSRPDIELQALAHARVSLYVSVSACTLEMAGNILKGGRVAINVECSNIGGIDQAQLLLKEAGEVGGCCVKSDMLTFAIVGGGKELDLHRPSEAMEAPERRKSSEPIWMEKTLSEGRVQAGDLLALAGLGVLKSAAMVEAEEGRVDRMEVG